MGKGDKHQPEGKISIELFAKMFFQTNHCPQAVIPNDPADPLLIVKF